MHFRHHFEADRLRTIIPDRSGWLARGAAALGPSLA